MRGVAPPTLKLENSLFMNRSPAKTLVRCLGIVLMLVTAAAGAPPALRPPAVPLVACDPYFSIWSPADKLTDADTVHWTGRPHRLARPVGIDGQGFPPMGQEPASGAPAP